MTDPNLKHAPSLGLTIVPNRTSKIAAVKTESRVLHEEIEIKCFFEGSSTLLIGNETISVKSGDVVIINPFEFHATVHGGEQTQRGKYHLFMLPLDFFSSLGIGDLPLHSLLLANNQAFQTLFRQGNSLYPLLMRAAQEYEEQAPAYAARIHGLMIEVFVILLRTGMRERSTPDPKADRLRVYRLIEPALRDIRDHYAEHITIDRLAECCRVSKHYFCHIFKDVTAQTAMDYLRNYRLKIADVLLQSTDHSIAEIAERCGFESTAYFCRCYKQAFGVSPGTCR